MLVKKSITAERVVTPGGVSSGTPVAIEQGLIAGFVEGLVSERFDRATLFPGFIDVHIHGAAGVDVNTADADGLLEIASFLAKHGVTAWLPTLVPDSDPNYERAISAIDRLMEIQEGRPIAHALGVHYEGVFANAKMCGALRPKFFKSFTGSELSSLPVPSSGVRMMTVAPEVDGGIELIRELKRQGWIISIGHFAAEPNVLEEAYAAGARHLTHFFNAMTGLHHRDVGVVGWGLSRPELTFDIVADGVHIAPEMLRFACESRSPDNVALISDSVAPAGLGDGRFEVWDETVTVADGRTSNSRGSIAGSVITMLDAVKRMLSLGFSEVDVMKMSSLNPARLIGLSGERGSIEEGKRADLVGLDQDGNVVLTLIGGLAVG